MRIPFKVVSGGQTGVDRAALDAAIELGIPYGGWLVHGRKTEEGPLPERCAGMQELSTSNYRRRTEQNVIDSDITIAICRGTPEGGTKRTIDYAKKHMRNCYIHDLAGLDGCDVAALWLRGVMGMIWDEAEDPSPIVINFAGPRASKDPAIYADAKRVIQSILVDLQA